MKKDTSYVVSIYSKKDIDLITDNTKYINLNVTNPDVDVINFFLKNGENYLYSEIINNKCGYIYISYEEFYKSEEIINFIYANMPDELTKLEIARYLYISIPKYVFFDINLDSEKNENYNLSLMNSINNLWGSLSLGRVNDKSISKIYYYMLRRLDIDAELITSINNDSYVRLNIDKMSLITDLFNDIPFVQIGMKTLHFGTYNEDIDLDKKVKYIRSRYTDTLLDKQLKDIDYNSPKCVSNMLIKCERIIDIERIKPVELSIIFEYIFNRYCPQFDIRINNLYLNNKEKKHFLVISYGDMHYSYNYKKKSFVLINDKDIINNINSNKIGLYMDEFVPNISNL